MTETKEYALDNKKSPKYLMVHDDKDIVASVEALRLELESLHNRFNQATAPPIIDSIIYEMQAVQLRYMYYLDLCKEHGVVSEEWKL